jgi:hypothetical protein
MFIAPTAHLVIGLQIGTTAHVFRQSRLQAQRLAEHVLPPLQVRIATPQPVQGELAERLPAQRLVRNERPLEHVSTVDASRKTELRGRSQGVAVYEHDWVTHANDRSISHENGVLA